MRMKLFPRDSKNIWAAIFLIFAIGGFSSHIRADKYSTINDQLKQPPRDGSNDNETATSTLLCKNCENWRDYYGEYDPQSIFSVPQFQKAEGNIEEGPNGKILRFSIVVEFATTGIFFSKPADIASATVFVSSNHGETWRKIEMAFAERWESDGVKEKWHASVPLENISPGEKLPILYFFRAETIFGGVAAEMPITHPNWPPTTSSYFPATASELVDFAKYFPGVPRALISKNAFVAFDGAYIYTAFQTEGGILPFTALAGQYLSNRTIPNIYAIQYMPIEPVHSVLFFFHGKWQLYAPLLASTVTPFQIFTLDDKVSHLFDFCTARPSPVSTNGIDIGISDNALFSRVPLSRICPGKCESLRIGFAVMTANEIERGFTPFVQAFLPYFNVYFRVHSIGGEIQEAMNGTVADLEPPTMFAPEPGSSEVSDWTLWPAKNSDLDELKEIFDEYPLADARIFRGPGPFRVSPCDEVVYENFRFEVYERNSRVKMRIFENENLRRTIMIGSDTKPRRDEQHKTPVGLVKLSNFSFSPLSCDFEIVK